MRKDYKFKYDTHCHTKEISWCATSTSSELIDAYYAEGYSGIVITDHFFNGPCRVSEKLPWPQRINQFCEGYNNALKHSKKYKNFDVFFGWEYNDEGTEFLTLGLGPEFLLRHPDMLEWSTEFYLNKVHEEGGFLIHAHPFRKRDYIKELKYYPEYIDAVEIVNSSNSGVDEEVFDEKAKDYAKSLELPGTRGTDCHDVRNLSGEGLMFNKQMTSIHELIKAISENDFI